MTKHPLGRTGLQASVLGFGAAPIGFLPVEQDRVGQVLNQLLDGGVNVLDTAAMYHGSEEMIGRHVGHRRDQYIIVSKCGTGLDGIDAPEWSAELISAAVDRSLQRLRTDHIDVMLLHTCEMAVLQTGEAIGALLKAHEQGKVRFPGYSGDNETVAWAAAQKWVEVVEMSINIVDQANIDMVLPVCRKHNVGVLAKRPIANAAWKDPSQQEGFYRKYSANYTERLGLMGLNPADLGFAGPPEKVWPEIALRFTLAQPGVTTALIGTTKPESVQMNLESANKGPLPAEAVNKIRKAFATAEKASGERWAGKT